ncbi:FtsK/SpoIIIE domain-containing protein [Humibacillus xanthopallidus]|uniref:S-DNA-T family DNA segregation ATPase FtsK/SpoIIIE n=1 Tax=Humibacillus xanthopallidus TaxID=412689 RepID=A0A543H9Y7_9MICO|nr:FtsK/SpoIIIE domain-containing protein [Humibacillus xanthopallidus]TQM55152.1 S-DNA-T family DNA segregation ATPase FtsK/SpoIIIE [Humibacillus xanthopallidus]
MKLKFVLRSGERETDLVATTDSATTVGDLAAHLAASDPHRSSALGVDASMTLALVDQEMRGLDPRATVAESGLQSGMRVMVTRAGEGFADRGRPAAVAVIRSGPDAGQQIPLARGTAYVGRGRGCEVHLRDESVSRRHAKLVISEVVEVVDLGSANGITAGGQQVTRAHLGSGDVVRLGDTELEVHLQGDGVLTRPGSGVLSGDAGVVAFSRSPRVAPLYAGEEFQVPDLPERGRATPLPIVAMVVPLLMGAVLFAITKSPFSIIFMLMMPVMMAGTYWEARRQQRKDFAQAMEDFREDLAILSGRIRSALDREGHVRRSEHPSGEQCLTAVRDRSALLWTRRRDVPGFGELRLGIGTLTSRSSIRMPAVGRSKAEAWIEVAEQLHGLEIVPEVPVVARPLGDGAVGVCGPRPGALGAARSLVTQAVALHSPAELVVCSFASGASAADWDFLKWLPHTTSPHSPVEVAHLAASAPACSALADALEDLVSGAADALGSGSTSAGPAEPGGAERPTVLVLVESDAPIDRSRLVAIAERGHRHGVVVVWVAETQTLLPAACHTFLVVGDDLSSLAGYVRVGEQVQPVAVDHVTDQEAMAAARQLAPVVDAGVPVDDASDLPRAVSLLTLTGTDLAGSEEAVVEKWVESRSVLTGPYAPAVLPRTPGNLRAVVGQSSQGTFSVDIRSDGPHALVGGTTGAGKSELLQAWILGMAAAHSPQRVTFLLVDYKGGSAFRDCVKLPHTVGLVTDLSPHLVRRALASLAAELHHREHLLARHKAKDLVELERRGEVDAPPSLIIVVDEFAALVQEVPEFVDGVVNVAQRGRSLGLHLILATQRPAGVIKDNLRANTNLRMALRMADENDSDDVLGSKEAAFFDPALPGRAVSKTGPGRLVPFQTAYAGGWTSDVPPPPDMVVETLTFGAGVQWEPQRGEGADGADDAADLGPTDIQRLVATLGRAAKVAQLPKPRKPWLPDMRPVYDLATLPTQRRDDELVFGVADDPDRQAQPEIAFRPDKEGNMAVYGTSGSGKSVFLRTIAVAAGYTVRGGPCQVYGLDFGNRGLAMLEALPHVGSIVPGGDHERVTRLLRMLRATIDERASRYSAASASTITDYRRIAGRPEEPRVIVLIDGMTAFRQAYEVGGRFQWLDLLAGLAADGRPVGVHFIIASDQRSGLPTNLAAAVQGRLILRMSSSDDYSVFGVPGDVLTMASPPGRGLMAGQEVQVAVLGGSTDVTVQAAAVAAFAESTRKAGVTDAPPIESLAELIALGDLPPESGGRPVIGVASATLEPHGFDPKGTFIITGPSGSGRTTALAATAAGLYRFSSSSALYLMTPRRQSELLELGVWAETAVGAEAATALAGALAADVEAGRITRPVAVFVERVDDLAPAGAENALTSLVKACVDNDQLVVAEGESGFFTTSYGLQSLLKTSRSGLALHPDGNEGLSVFKANLPALNRAELSPGRGFVVEKGRFELLQVALP